MRSNGGSVFTIKRIVNHENFTLMNFNFDFALLELSEPLNFTNKIQPIELSGVNDAIQDEQLCKTSGWGIY